MSKKLVLCKTHLSTTAKEGIQGNHFAVLPIALPVRQTLLNHENTIPGAASRLPFLPEQRGRALCDQPALSLPHLPAIKIPKLLQQQALCPALFLVLPSRGWGWAGRRRRKTGALPAAEPGPPAAAASTAGGRGAQSPGAMRAVGRERRRRLRAPGAGSGSAPGAEQLRRAPRAGPSRAPRPWAREGPAAAPRPAGDRAPFPVLPAAWGRGSAPAARREL